jgi:hypothetical protein
VALKCTCSVLTKTGFVQEVQCLQWWSWRQLCSEVFRCVVCIFIDISRESDPSRLKGSGFLWNVGMANWLITCERALLTVCLPHLPVHVQHGLSVIRGHSVSHICTELMIGWTTYTLTRLQSVMPQKVVLTVGVVEVSVSFQIRFLWGAVYTVRMIIDWSQFPKNKAFVCFSFMSYVTFVSLMVGLRVWSMSLFFKRLKLSYVDCSLLNH